LKEEGKKKKEKPGAYNSAIETRLFYSKQISEITLLPTHQNIHFVSSKIEKRSKSPPLQLTSAKKLPEEFDVISAVASFFLASLLNSFIK
jgi:hypothetical protein